MLLAIDTATRLTSLALYDGRDLLAEHSWRTQDSHIQLAPAVQSLMDEAEVRVNDLTALAVSVGPGSYSGLRVGVSFAKGIAGARGLPLVGFSTLDTLAAAHPGGSASSALVTVVLAGRGRVIVQTYKWRKGKWEGRGEPTIMTWDALIESLDGAATLTGEIDAIGYAALDAAIARGLPLTVTAGVYRMRRAGFIAAAAWEMLQSADAPARFSPDRLTPLYVKTDE